MKKPVYLLAGTFVILIAAGGLWLRSPDEEATDLMVNAVKGPFRVTVTTTGELRAKQSERIFGPRRAQQARIFQMKISRLVPEGTVVKKGDFVAELDRSELTSKLKDAEIEVQKAESAYEQALLDTTLELSKARDNLVDLKYAMEEAQLRKEQAAYEPPSVQRQETINFEKAERNYERSVINYDTQVQQAVARMKGVEADLDKTKNQLSDLQSVGDEFTVTAPADGMVVYDREWNGQRKVVGSTLNSWDPVVATLPDLSVMESVTYVNEVDIQKIEVGQHVDIGLDALSDKKLTGTVTRVANIGEQRPNSDAKVFEVTITVNESDSTLRPALTTSNTIVVAETTDVVRVPLESIYTQADSINYVLTKDGRRVVRQEVQLGMLNDNEAVVKAGLDEGDPIYLSLPADTAGAPLRRLDEKRM